MNVRFDPRVSPFPLIESEKFCEYDYDHLHDLVPQRLINPIRELMQTRMELNAARRSFGTIDAEKALKFYEQAADEVYEALKMLWSEV